MFIQRKKVGGWDKLNVYSPFISFVKKASCHFKLHNSSTEHSTGKFAVEGSQHGVSMCWKCSVGWCAQGGFLSTCFYLF